MSAFTLIGIGFLLGVAFAGVLFLMVFLDAERAR